MTRDKVKIISGRYNGKSGKITRVFTNYGHGDIWVDVKFNSEDNWTHINTKHLGKL